MTSAPPAIRLDHVRKVHSRTGARARSLKRILLSGFRRADRGGGTVVAADDLCLEVQAGSALGVIGANGAGKSTLLRMVAGITEPTSGRVETRGRVLPLLELGAGFHPDLSGYENVFLQGSLFGMSRSEMRRLLPSIVDFAEIGDFLHMPVRHYSSGMYVRLGFSISAHLRPDILLVDEAFSVGDIHFQEKCTRRMQEFHRQGGTFLLVSHDTSLVEKVCDEVLWIDQGAVEARGRPADVTHRYKKRMFESGFPAPVPIFHEGLIVSGRPGRFGNGRILLEYAEFLDGDGVPLHTWVNGAPLQVRLRYHPGPAADGEAQTDMDCVLLGVSQRGHPAFCASSRQMGCRLRPDPQGGTLVFRWDRVDLSPGTYTLFLTLSRGGDTTAAGVYDMHSRIYNVTVAEDASRSQIAALAPAGRWEHQPDA